MRKKEIGELVIDRKEKNSVKSINFFIKAKKNEESGKEQKIIILFAETNDRRKSVVCLYAFVLKCQR